MLLDTRKTQVADLAAPECLVRFESCRGHHLDQAKHHPAGWSTYPLPISNLGVTNIGNEAQSYFGTNQKLVDTSGREYEANSTADMWANKGTGDINPGNSIQVQVAFDVPPGHTARRARGSRLCVLGRCESSALMWAQRHPSAISWYRCSRGSLYAPLAAGG